MIALTITLLTWFGIKPSDLGNATRKYVFRSRYTVFYFVASLINFILLFIAIYNNFGWLDYSIYIWGVVYLTSAYLNVQFHSSKLANHIFNILQNVFSLVVLAWAIGILINYFDKQNVTQITDVRELWISLIRAGFFIFVAGFIFAGNIVLGVLDKRYHKVKKDLEEIERELKSLKDSIDENQK